MLSLFVGLVFFGVQIAKQSRDKFGYLIAMGITSWFAVQALVNIGVTLDKCPIQVLPLPFISYGGSSLVVGMAAIGIMINIGQPRKR